MDVSGSDVCPTEDAIQCFLDLLLDPMLPAKSCMRVNPSPSQQHSVAKQVHAVVLLYNYYHRKQCPKLELLRFNSFCKLVVDLKPALLAHMKFMKKSTDAELDDLDKQLSLTERAIMDACQISVSLDASSAAPNTDHWPISKVSVFLVDSKKEKCFLQFSSMTQGVWSLIDTNLEFKDYTSDDTKGLKHVNKKKRITGNPSRKEQSIDETSCQKLAYSAITEVIGIAQNDLVILENHVVFSDGKDKAAAWLFIVQCTRSGKGNIFEVPIKDVIDSLQGPLVKKSSGSWIVTTVVDYFHVLPYAEILSNWFSRKEFSNGLPHSRLGAENVNLAGGKCTETPCKPEICKNQEESQVTGVVIEDLGSNTKSSVPQSWKQKDSNGCCKIDLAHAMEFQDSSTVAMKEKSFKRNSRNIELVSHQDDMHSCIESEIPKAQDKLSHVNHAKTKDTGNNISSSTPRSYKQKDTTSNKNINPAEALSGRPKLWMADSSLAPLKNVESCKKNSNTMHVFNQQNKISSIGTELNCSISNAKVEAVNRITYPSLTDCRVTDIAGHKFHSSQESKGGRIFATCQSEKLQISIASKEHMSQTALKVLMKKRNELSLKKRNIEDEIAWCAKDIQTILNGGEDDSAVIVESLIEGCNDGYLRNERIYTVVEEECSPKSIKRKSLSETILNKQNRCQELDIICCKKSLVLPTYSVSLADGGFQADVTIEGLDCKCSSEGDAFSNPSEARESAALQMLEKLRSMLSQKVTGQ